jgi:hypothetical protein
MDSYHTLFFPQFRPMQSKLESEGNKKCSVDTVEENSRQKNSSATHVADKPTNETRYEKSS